ASPRARRRVGISILIERGRKVCRRDQTARQGRREVMMSELGRWQERYREGDTPWDSGRPSLELQRVVAEDGIVAGLALELGCGTGTNAVWLASQGFDVTAVDLSPLAIERAERRAREAGIRVRFLVADLLDPPDLGGPYDFFFD